MSPAEMDDFETLAVQWRREAAERWRHKPWPFRCYAVAYALLATLAPPRFWLFAILVGIAFFCVWFSHWCVMQRVRLLRDVARIEPGVDIWGAT